jgi:hypothetical protein
LADKIKLKRTLNAVKRAIAAANEGRGPADGGPAPLGPTAAHEPAPTARGAWARWKSLGATSDHKLMRVSA